MSATAALTLALIVPLIAALVLPFLGRWPDARETVTLVAAFGLFAAVASLYMAFSSGDVPELILVSVMPGLDIAFRVEPLGMLFALVAATLWIAKSFYSIGYMRDNNEHRQTLFYTCFAFALASTMGLAFAKNLFTLFLCYEALTLSTYPLVTHKANEEAVAGGRVYLMLLIGTSMVLLLPAIIITWSIAGTTNFAAGGILADKLQGPALGLLLALFIFGIGKAAVMPLHFWLPAAMVAPTPVSALLHAVAVVKAGVFTVVKVIVYVFGVDALSKSGQGDWLLYAAGFTILAASLVALRQDNLKKRLAYSTVSQLSYVILAAAILTPISVAGAAIHIAAHAVSKITLFFAAGSIYTAAHLTEISQLDGIGRRMPWTMGAFTIGALSMIGLPPTAGFLGKWFMLSGAMSSGQWVAVGVIMASTILNAAYFLPVIYRAFFCDVAPDSHAHGEAPWPVVAALTATAAGTVLLFIFPDVPLSLANQLVGR